MTNDIQTFYDLTAERTADEWYSNEALLPTIREFIECLPAKPRVLDLGCGPGYESMRLNREGAEVLGIDFSEESIRVARERCQGCRFEVMDFIGLDDRFGKFDGVFSSASLIHVAPNDMEKVVGNISGVLNNDGCFLAIIRDGEGIDEQWSELCVEGRKLRRTVYLYSKERLFEISQKNGLRFVRESCLDGLLLQYGWHSYLFQKDREQ